MITAEGLQRTTTVRELCALARSGDVLLLDCEDVASLEVVRDTVLTSFPPDSSFLVTFRPDLPPQVCPSPRNVLVVSSDRSSRTSLASLRERLSRVGKHAPVFLVWDSPHEGWQNDPAERERVLGKLVQQLRSRKGPSIVLVTRGVADAKAVAALAASCSTVVSFWWLATHLQAQVIYAPGIAEPRLFLPRRVTRAGKDLILSPPLAPEVLPPAVSPADDSVPAVTVIDRLQEPYRRALESLPEPVLLFSANGALRSANDRLLTMLGRTDDEFRSLELRDVAAPDSYRALLRGLVRLRQSGRTTIEANLRRRSGATVTVELAGVSLTEGRYVVSVRDITDRRKAEAREAARVETTKKQEQIVPFAQCVAVNRKIVWANDPFCRLFYWAKRPGITPLGMKEVFGEHNAGTARHLSGFVGKTEREARQLREELRWTTPQNEPLVVECTGVPELHDGKESVRLSFVDITEWRESLTRLERSEAQYRLLIETRAATLVLLRGGKVAFANKGFLELMGVLFPEDILGTTLGELIPARERRTYDDALGRWESGEESSPPVEVMVKRPDGVKLFLRLAGERIDVEGQPAVLCAVTDISGLRDDQQSVQRERRELDTLEKLLTAFHASLDLDEVLSMGLAASLRPLGFDSGGMWRPGDTAGTFVLAVAENLSPAIREKLATLTTSEGIGGFLAKTIEPATFSLDQYPAFLPHRSLFEAEGIRSVAFVPLAARERLEGLMLLFSTKPETSAEVDLHLLHLASRHCGVALHHALEFHTVKEALAQHRSALEEIGPVVYEMDAGGRYRYLSPSVVRLLGHSAQELTTNADLWRSLVHPDDRSTYSQRIAGGAGESEAITLEYRILPKGKAAYRTVHDIIRYRRGSGGELLGIHGAVSEIPPGEREEDDRRDADRILRGVIDAMGDALVMTDLEARVIEVNRRFTELTGYSRNEILGEGMPYPWMSDEETSTLVSWLDELRARHSLQDFDMKWRRRDGHETAISLNTTLLRNAVGDPIAILNFARDISERKRRNEELLVLHAEVQAQVERLTVLYELGKELTGVAEADTVFRVVHDAVQKLLPHQACGIDVYDPRADTLHARFRSPVAEGPLLPAELGRDSFMPASSHPAWEALGDRESVLFPFGDERSLLVLPLSSGTAIRAILWILLPAGTTVGEPQLRMVENIGTLSAIALDRVRLHEEIVERAREIDMRNEDLDRYAYVVSHDLKEPLIMIDGYARILLAEESGRQAEYLHSIVRAGERMKRLIDDLLTLSRIGRTEGSSDTVPLQAIVQEVLRDLEFVLQERHARVTVPDQLPRVRYNATELAMVLRNLILNGVKFNSSPAPEVVLTIGENDEEYAVSVEDNGIGIPEDQQETVFHIFRRLHPPGTYEGTGAGLTIVKKIVEVHGGGITVAGRPGGGSIFTFTIPKHG